MAIQFVMTIRDPIHGTVRVTQIEKRVIDLPLFQRLRGVKQLGFAELAFPGATHSRYAHSIGVMHLAGRVMKHALRHQALAEGDKTYLIQLARLTALLHDVGHAPLSHSSERLMPQLSTLGLPAWVSGQGPAQRRAHHEDFTVHLLLNSPLRTALEQALGAQSAELIAAVIVGCEARVQAALTYGGVDYFPLLRQLISSECDADRMDYLLRDSFYTGVNYGQYDHDWLGQHLTCHVEEQRAFLALGSRAVFAFEDFLLSRYHMFMAVYYHHVPVGFDYLMERYAETQGQESLLPSDPESYMAYDDVKLMAQLRASKSPWAQMLAARRGYQLLLEMTERDRPIDREALKTRLDESAIDHFTTRSTGVLSKYGEQWREDYPIFVLNEALGQVSLLHDYTPLFERYARGVDIYRLYCEPSHTAKAKAHLQALLKETQMQCALIRTVQ